MHILKLTQIGNSVGVILPKEVFANLKLEKGKSSFLTEVADLAAAYGCEISQNDPFVDGNKLAALLSVGLFPALNGYCLAATQAQTTVPILALAAGELEEAEFAAWLREHLVTRKK